MNWMTSSTISTSKPANYEEFYEDWYPKALSIARRGGAVDPEATAQDLMIVFLTSDYLERYDPTREGAVTFESWVNAILYRRMSSVYKSQKRRKGSMVLYTDEVPEEEFLHPDIAEYKSAVRSVFLLLRERYGAEQAKLWVAIVRQVTQGAVAVTGRVRQYELAARLDWSESKVGSELRRLRYLIETDQEIAEALHGYRSRFAA